MLPAVAPFESVSRPPDTARHTEPPKSPSAWVRAAAMSAVLGTAWTQWQSRWEACSSSTTTAKSGVVRASRTAWRTARASREPGGTTVSPALRQAWTSRVPVVASAMAAAVNIAAYTPLAVWVRAASRYACSAARPGSPGLVQPCTSARIRAPIHSRNGLWRRAVSGARRR